VVDVLGAGAREDADRLGALLMLNPMTPIIDAYRATLLRQELPAAAPFAYAAVVAMARD